MAAKQLINSSFSNSRIDKVYYGQGCLANLPAEVDRLGASRAFIITGNSLMKQGTLLSRIQDLLGDRCAGVFSETKQHVPRESVLAATRAAQKADADLLISFGGGSPNDTAKLVALCMAENVTSAEQLDRYRIRFQYPDQLEVPTPENPCLPHISITTTLSAGEFTNFAGSTAKAMSTPTIRLMLSFFVLDENICWWPASWPIKPNWVNTMPRKAALSN